MELSPALLLGPPKTPSEGMGMGPAAHQEPQDSPAAQHRTAHREHRAPGSIAAFHTQHGGAPKSDSGRGLGRIFHGNEKPFAEKRSF